MTNPSIGAIIAHAKAQPARAGDTRIVLIDGPAGSGKTTLASRLAAELTTQVLHGDDMYEGWTGMDTLWDTLGPGVLEPLARGLAGAFQRWDWEDDARADVIDVPVADFLIIEGVATAQRRARAFAACVVWVEVPWEMRLARGLERDGKHMRAHWEAWSAQEVEHFEREGTREAADFTVDGALPVPD